MIILYGIHDVHGTMNWLWSQPTLIPWIPHGIPHGFHGFQVDSIWIILGKVKTSKFFKKDILNTHKAYHLKLEAWSTINPSVIENIHKKLFNHAV